MPGTVVHVMAVVDLGIILLLCSASPAISLVEQRLSLSEGNSKLVLNKWW